MQKCTPLINAVARTTALARYLQSFRLVVGEKDYISSFIRKEHGTGAGFFGVSNTGSRDCLKESIRGVTDALKLTFKTPENLIFRSKSCLGLQEYNSKIHRIEHTVEVNDLFLEFEMKFIYPDTEIDFMIVGKWIIKNQITTWIEQLEQRRKKDINKHLPFSKYTTQVFYMGTDDVSKLTRPEVQEINYKHFIGYLDCLSQASNAEALEKAIISFDGSQGRPHTLPSIDLASTYLHDECALLYHHYGHKLRKRTTETSRWYSKADAERYLLWLRSRS
jgi:hypothetical protein